jgi:hypothetical protein
MRGKPWLSIAAQNQLMVIMSARYSINIDWGVRESPGCCIAVYGRSIICERFISGFLILGCW